MTTTVLGVGEAVFVVPDEPHARNNYGEIIPDYRPNEEVAGVVESVGDGLYNPFTGQRQPIPFTPGDRVGYARWDALRFAVDGRDLVLLRDWEVWPL